MSTDRPGPDDLLPPAAPGEAVVLPPAFAWSPPPPRPKFQHNYKRHLIFFLLTLVTTSLTSFWMLLFAGINPLPFLSWSAVLGGLWYSVPVLAILSAHEFGHYFACRYYNVDATLPYFIPAPLPLTGTLGAVIRIREAFPSKRALFDIGVAGPLAGFVALVPLLWWGMTMSSLIRVPTDEMTLYFGEPLLWKAFEWLYFGAIPEGMDVALHPVGFAAWWGMLATALNLLPFGQLDGGHIMYASLGRRATWMSGLSLLTVLLLAVRSASWVSMAVMMMAMAILFGFRHPRIIDEHEPLDRERQWVAVLAAVVFVLCFTPVPIDVVGGE